MKLFIVGLVLMFADAFLVVGVAVYGAIHPGFFSTQSGQEWAEAIIALMAIVLGVVATWIIRDRRGRV